MALDGPAALFAPHAAPPAKDINKAGSPLGGRFLCWHKRPSIHTLAIAPPLAGLVFLLPHCWWVVKL